jgi:hypothetical protein
VRLVLAVLALALTVLTAVGCTGDPLRPRAMAALGDSITHAFAACGPLHRAFTLYSQKYLIGSG